MHLSKSDVSRHVMFIFQIMAYWLLSVCWMLATVYIIGAGKIHILNFWFNFSHLIMCGISCIIDTIYCMFLFVVVVVVVVILSNVNGFIRWIFTHILQSCFVVIGAVVLLLAFGGWGKISAQTTFWNACSWMKMLLIWHSSDFSAMVQSTISQNWPNSWRRIVDNPLSRPKWSSLTHWSRYKMAAISTSSKAFSWTRIFKCRGIWVNDIYMFQSFPNRLAERAWQITPWKASMSTLIFTPYSSPKTIVTRQSKLFHFHTCRGKWDFKSLI